MLLQFGFNSLGAGLGVPGFADGGVLPANGPAIVGENGPELVINRGGQSRVFSNRDSQAALSRYSPANARSIEELAMSGGGSTKSEWGGASGTATTFKLETTVINGVEYATVDQVRAMGAKASSDGAKQGEARALRRLQMSPAARRKAGF